MSKEVYWRITYPGGNDRFIMFWPAQTAEQMREQHPQATAVAALPQAQWMAESGRAYGVPAVK